MKIFLTQDGHTQEYNFVLGSVGGTRQRLSLLSDPTPSRSQVSVELTESEAALVHQMLDYALGKSHELREITRKLFEADWELETDRQKAAMRDARRYFQQKGGL